jgi:benzaldehyde dehydrogenase (NAD)
MNIQARDFIAVDRWRGKAFLGEWSATDGGVMEISDPATRAVLGSVGIADPKDIAKAACEARQAHPAWAAKLPQERAAILNKAADLLEQNGEELIGWIMRESGSIQPKAAIEIEHGAAFVRHAAAIAIEPNGIMLPSMEPGRSNTAKRVPHGVVGVISPFNFPLVLSIRAIAAALAVGNAVVHKPDPRTAVSGGIIIARLFEDAGLPKGVLQVVPGGAAARRPARRCAPIPTSR